MPPCSAGKGAFFVAEQFGFDQFGGNGRAIQRDKGAGAARAFLVNGARDEFLARAGFALDRDARFACGHALHLRQQPLHHRPGPDDFVLPQPAPQIAIFVFEVAQAQNIFDGHQQFFRGERLFQEIHSAKPRGAHGRFHAGLAGNHHHRSGYSDGLEILEQRNSILAGHHDIRKNHVEALRANQFQRARGAVTHRGLVSGKAKCAGKRRERVRIVVDQQQMRLERES